MREPGSSIEGYRWVYCPMHPSAMSNGYVIEHRAVAEATIGRFLKPGEVVHHINKIRDDNRPANLVVCTPLEHGWFHRTAQCGTESRYVGGCRCDECRAAATEARRIRRNRGVLQVAA